MYCLSTSQLFWNKVSFTFGFNVAGAITTLLLVILQPMFATNSITVSLNLS